MQQFDDRLESLHLTINKQSRCRNTFPLRINTQPKVGYIGVWTKESKKILIYVFLYL